MQNAAADPLTIYRKSYPDITQQEAEMLYPLFLQATEAGQAAEQWRYNLSRYQAALAPIRERNQQKDTTHQGGKIWTHQK